MNRKPFIPREFRPHVPGSKLQKPVDDILNFQSSSKIAFQGVLLISAKEDIVPDAFLKEINSEEKIQRLFYDDLGISWDFVFHNNILTIYTSEIKIIPKSIYHRHPGVSREHTFYRKHMAFFEVLDIWNGILIGQRRDHHQNASKAYQAITSIREAAKNNEEHSVRYPRSFFLKGNYSQINTYFRNKMIVKSCSNVRSKVVSEDEFQKWDIKNLRNLPTFFQEKIMGIDIRVHVCEDVFWSLMINGKDHTDYRYASKNSISYNEIEIPNFVKTFCRSLSVKERNTFVGIDFMMTDDGYFCFESNPGPGWSTFNHPSKRGFANCVLNALTK